MSFRHLALGNNTPNDKQNKNGPSTTKSRKSLNSQVSVYLLTHLWQIGYTLLKSSYEYILQLAVPRGFTRCLAPIGRSVMLYSLYPSSINGLSNAKRFFEFKPVVSEISTFKQNKKCARKGQRNINFVELINETNYHLANKSFHTR